MIEYVGVLGILPTIYVVSAGQRPAAPSISHPRTPPMPKLLRSDWYDLARDTNWTFRYVSEKEVFPEELSGTQRVHSELCTYSR